MYVLDVRCLYAVDCDYSSVGVSEHTLVHFLT